MELAEVFPSQSSVDLDFTLVTEPVLGFASEWVYESNEPFGDAARAFSLVLDVMLDKPFEFRVQYDSSGDGTADYTTPATQVARDNQVHSFPELGMPGYYRIIVSKMRPDTHLRAITWGPTRY